MGEAKRRTVDVAERIFRLGLNLQQLNKRLERVIGMSLTQWFVLRRLVEMPGIPAGALASAIGIHPGTLTPTLQRLKRRGMLYLERDGYDARRKIVLLSRQGHARLMEVEERLFTLLREVEQDRFSAEDVCVILGRCGR